MTIQEAGSQYVAVLAALGAARTDEDGGETGPDFTDQELQEGREVAIGVSMGPPSSWLA